MLHIHEHGDPDQPTLLLLHGITDSGDTWPDAVARWRREYHVVSVDALGHGQSPRLTPAQLHDPVSALLQSTQAVLEHVGPAIIVGHSMGAGHAAVLATRRADLVRGLVLEDPPWFDRFPFGEEEQATADRVAECRYFSEEFDQALAEGREQHPEWPASEFLPWAHAHAQVDRELLETGKFRVDTPWQEIAADLSVPTLLITGDHDVILDPATLQEVTRLANPLIRQTVVPGADHCVRRSQPERYHEVVDQWLAELAGV